MRTVQDFRGTGGCRLVDIGLPVQHRILWQSFLWRRSPQTVDRSWTFHHINIYVPNVTSHAAAQSTQLSTKPAFSRSFTAKWKTDAQSDADSHAQLHHQHTINTPSNHQAISDQPRHQPSSRFLCSRRDQSSPLPPNSPNQGWNRKQPRASVQQMWEVNQGQCTAPEM